MYFSSGLVLALTLAQPVLGIPSTSIAVEKYHGKITGKHIVTLKPGVAPASFLNAANITATHQYTIINGFTSKLADTELNALRVHPNVESITEDGIMHAFSIQNNAPWGLARLSTINKLANQNPAALDFKYQYDDNAGNGTDIYVIDTGVNVDHVDFGGRARWGAIFGGLNQEDDNGHGTHCAGTAAGTQFGVAKLANIIAIKTHNHCAEGEISDIISAIEYVLDQSKTSGRPSVASMSFGGPISSALDNAVNALTSAGIHVVAAAGNDNIDANEISPARVASAITVAASTIGDEKASFSNWGSVVDIFAPGDDIISASVENNTATEVRSGTSMAAPHVSGLIAYFISSGGNLPPADMADKLQTWAIQDSLTGVPSKTANWLANNGYD